MYICVLCTLGEYITSPRIRSDRQLTVCCHMGAGDSGPLQEQEMLSPLP